MSLLYSDPWKDNPYGKLQGEMVNVWTKLSFEEIQVHKHENTYVLAGRFTSLAGVNRSYKPEQAIEYPCLATMTVHSQDYQVRKKNDEGKYHTVTYKASIHEKLLYQHITDNPTQWLEPNKSLAGDITFLPDDNYKVQSNNPQLPIGSHNIQQIPSSGTLPEWVPPKQSKGNWNGGKGIGIEDKVDFLKKELTETILDDTFKDVVNNAPLSLLVAKVIEERRDDEIFLASYFDLVKAIVS